LPHYKIAPGPPDHFLFGSMREIRHDPLRFALEMARHYGDVVRIRFLFWPTYLVHHPDGVKHVLQENQRNYSKDLYPYRMLKPFLGQGLVTNDGESWLQQRRLMQPGFHRKRLAAFGTLITGAAVSLLDQWHSYAGRDQPVDVAAEMLRLTLRIAGQALFNVDLSAETEVVGQAVATVNRLLSEYLSAPFPPLSIPTPRSHRLQAARRTLDRVVHEIITQRRRQNSDTGDLLLCIPLGAV
jgi:cytochrome P450